ncbi:hypothetical protein ACROYT_G027677 [Oculina patagonica]
MTEAKDIDAIDNIMDMVRIMEALGVSLEGLQTLNEMKDRVKETLTTSERKSSWTAKEAFSVLTEAKEEDERKRATLYQFYEDTEDCLSRMDSKVLTLLELNIGNLKDKIAMNKRNLKQKEYIALVAGETSSGKSTLLNLILGEKLLPFSHLSTTSPLSQGIVIVDCPSVGESIIVDDMVKEYLPEAFAFIYVINSGNIAGIQKGMVRKLIEHARKVSLDQQSESSATQALFVCNKWDQVPPDEADEVRKYIIKELKQCWPSLDPESQIIYMSSTNALRAQVFGIITDEFAGLMNGIRSMVLKSIEARLQAQWRWLEYLLSRMVYQTKALILNSHKDRSKVNERMVLITDRLVMIEKQQSSVNKELQKYLENKTDNAVSKLSKYLKSSGVVGQFTSWTLDDVPNMEDSWQVTKHYIQKALMKRLQDVIAAWEEEHHVFADARTSLIQYFKQRFNFVEEQLRNLETSILAEDATSPASSPVDTESFTVAERVIIGVTSPIWVPVGLVALIVSAPVVGAMAVKEKFEDWSKTRKNEKHKYGLMAEASKNSDMTEVAIEQNLRSSVVEHLNDSQDCLKQLEKYEKDKCAFMARASKEYLTEAAEEQNLRSYVVEQLKESRDCLKKVLALISELIDAAKMLCQQLKDEHRSRKEIDFYKPLYQKSLKLRERIALFGIKDVCPMDISCSDLEWNDDQNSHLGTGTFAFVFRGTLKQPERNQPVALKVWKEELNHSNASAFLAEKEMLRKLNCPFIVKFFGAALLNEGDRVRAILVMELCKGNLMRHIFLNPKNIPGLPSSTPPTDRNTIRWAKEITVALEFIHEQGIVHRDFKLENVLITYEDVVKIADVGVSKQANMITGTMAGTPAYVAPEVIRSNVYDSKADIYSFGIIMWEMWYGKRAFLDVGGDLNTFFGKVVEGVRPSHVEGRRKPLDGWQHLMQWCWDGEADERPTAAMCHKELTKLYQKAITTI